MVNDQTPEDSEKKDQDQDSDIAGTNDQNQEDDPGGPDSRHAPAGNDVLTSRDYPPTSNL